MLRFSKEGHLLSLPACIEPWLLSSSYDLYLHSDLVSRSGMFCAIATAIDRCKTEALVDVFQVANAQCLHKPGQACDYGKYRMASIFKHLFVFVHFSKFE